MIDDATLKQIVLDELERNPKVDHAHIGVTAMDGAVGLFGHVQSYASRFAAVDAVDRIEGVKAISDEIVVNLPNECRREDADIAHDLAIMLDQKFSAAGNSLTATVSEGVVTLTGSVHAKHDRADIAAQAALVESITGIRNRIAVSPDTDAD